MRSYIDNQCENLIELKRSYNDLKRVYNRRELLLNDG